MSINIAFWFAKIVPTIHTTNAECDVSSITGSEEIDVYNNQINIFHTWAGID